MTVVNYAIFPNVIITHLNVEYANTARQGDFILEQFSSEFLSFKGYLGKIS